MFFGIGFHFAFNLLLQIFDGLFTYHALGLGIPEANPLVRGAISSWGTVGGLISSKLFACAMLGTIFALRHVAQRLALQALTLTSTIYAGICAISLCQLVWLP